jgi:Secretion system C-terminal sorting domain
VYGWGYYDINAHILYASAIFVLKYPDATYKKFKIDQYSAGYTISYATWDATTSTWGATTTTTIPNSTGTGYTYNFFSFATNSVVASIPADTHWDFVFTKYTADYYGDGSLMYPVTGVLQQYTTKVAKSSEGTIPAASAYSTKMNTIGYDWKTFNGTAYTLADTKYFVKSSDSIVYKVWFTAFEGSSTGNVSFKYTTELTSGISQETAASSSLSFTYLAASHKLVLQNVSTSSNVAVFSLTGQKVLETTVSDNSVLLDNLNSGIYVVRVKSGSESKQGKIIVP